MTQINVNAAVTSLFYGSGTAAYVILHDFIIYGNGNCGWGVDLHMASELPAHNEVHRVGFHGTFTSGWVNMDYNDESIIDDISPTSVGTTPLGLSLQHCKAVVRDSYMEGTAGPTAQISSSYTLEFDNCEMDTLKLTGGVACLRLLNHYNADDGTAILDLNGNSVNLLELQGFWDLKGAANFITNSSASTGTIVVLSYMVGYFVNSAGGAFTGGTGAINILGYGFISVQFGTPLTGFPMTNASPTAIQIVPTISTNPPASGTVYQNPNAVAEDLYIPIAFAASIASTVVIKVGPTSTPAYTVVSDSEPAAITGARTQTYRIRVPVGWYFSVAVTGTGTTIGTCVAVPAW
jgi:hypothetical protein